MRKRWLVLVIGVLVIGVLGVGESVVSAAAGGWGTKASRSQSKRFVGKGWVGKHTFAPRSRATPRNMANLTTEQKEKIANLKRTLEEERLTFQENTSELRSQLARKKLEMQKLLLAESPDLTRVYDLVDEIAAIQAEIQKKAIEFRLKVKSLPIKKQLEKLPGLGLGRGLGGLMGHSRTMVYGACWR